MEGKNVEKPLTITRIYIIGCGRKSGGPLAWPMLGIKTKTSLYGFIHNRNHEG